MGWHWKDFSDGSKRLRKGSGGTDAITIDKNGKVDLYLSAPMRYVDVTISTSQLLALFATPIALVPAPGAGFANIFEGAVAFLDYNSAAYGGIAAGEDLAIKYTNAAGLQVASCEATGFLDQTADTTRYVRPYAAASGASEIAPVANAALVLHMLTGEITTGNSPLKLRVYYRVVPTVL